MLLMNKHQLELFIRRFVAEMNYSDYSSKMGQTYKHCFRGIDAVDWIMKNTTAKSRQEAVFLGELLMHQKVFGPIEKSDYSFKDKTTIYQFRDINKIGKCIVTADYISLYYRTWKPLDQNFKGVILFVHGLGEYFARYCHLFDAWKTLGFIVYTFDLRGHGNSSGRRGHVPCYQSLVTDLIAILDLIDKDKDCCNLPLFIYSRGLGSQIVFNTCTQKSDIPNLRGIIACAPLIRFAEESHKELKKKMSKHLGPKQVIYFHVCHLISKVPENRVLYKEDTLCHGYLTTAMTTAIIEAGKKILSQAKAITTPVLIIHGDADKYASLLAAVDLHEMLGSKDKTFRLWPGLYHDMEHEPESNEISEVINEWITQRID
eukprot:TRINITY_DN1294_c0_g1_i5.p1 TRINITY_DN1294_c0_g1~~TRINITY_DN1294_c0_g1_i5.p1  ORF type:complete len:373 (-),score=29.28 TRINITY_DN1294_c0_g1_i5:52-1170(-)